MNGFRIALLAMMLAASATCGATAEWGVSQLMALLAANAGGRATFVEHKYLAILDAPVVSRGELVYIAPARLERHTVSPRADSMVLDGDALTITREGRSQQLRLRDYPEISAFIDSIRGTLAGDRSALERNWQLSVSGGPARWTLYLLPSDPKLATLVSRIQADGRGADLRSIEILQADGDRSVMQIERIAPADTDPT